MLIGSCLVALGLAHAEEPGPLVFDGTPPIPAELEGRTQLTFPKDRLHAEAQP